MADKKYYWLKLQRDFFKRHDVRIVEDMENGKDYILFYLKLLVESIDHEGYLRFSDTIPYNDKMLATITNTNIDIVRAALQIFAELGMLEVLDDNSIYMREVERMIGSAADNDNAKRQQRLRNRRKAEQLSISEDSVTKSNASVTECVTNNNESKSIEIDIDKDIDKELEKEKDISEVNDKSFTMFQTEHGKQAIYDEIVAHWNTLPEVIPRITKISKSGERKKLLDARLKEYGIEAIHKAIEEIPKSKFLLGQGNRGWTIKFDWFIKPNNFPKVLEGNYRGNVTQSSGNAYVDAINNRMDVVANFLNGGNQN